MSEEKRLKALRSLGLFNKAYGTLALAINEPSDEFIRDSVVKRLEYTFEISWKTLKDCLLYQHGIDVKSPFSTLKEAFKVGYIKDLDIWERILDLRNETVHAYGESYGNKAYTFAIEHHEIFADLLKSIQNELE